MRKETTNTFSEGIIGDLNPINMPSNALTDCLNGTVITYDGNELSLQNDKGNYPLENCKLKEGYIPIGMQEYGGIIYIVSYNPQENKAEIGSYPTISEIYKVDDPYENENDGKWIPDENCTYGYFCSKNPYNILMSSGAPEDYLINPGDQFKITGNVGLSTPLFYEYYLLDADQNSINVTEDIDVTSNDYQYSPWKSSGWLAYKVALPEIADFQINIKSLKRNSINNEVTFVFDINVEIEHTTDFRNYIGVSVKSSDDTINKTLSEDTVVLTELSNGRRIYSWQYSSDPDTSISVDEGDILSLTFTPQITISNNTVRYDSNAVTLTIDGSKSVSIEDIKIAENKFIYNINKEDKIVEFTYSSSNFDEVGLSNGDFAFHYDVSRYNWGENEWIPIIENETSDFTMYGEGFFSIDINDFTSENELSNSSLFLEDYYKITMWAEECSNDNSSSNKSSEKTMYIAVSDIIKYNTNVWGFDNENDLLNYELPIEKYFDTIEIQSKNLTFEKDTSTDPSFEIEGDDKYKFWLRGTNYCGGRYSRAFNVEERAQLGKDFNLNITTSIVGTFSLKFKASILTGPIWKNLVLPYVNIEIDGVGTPLQFDDYSGEYDSQNVFVGSSSDTYSFSTELPVKFELQNNYPFIGYDYSVIPLKRGPTERELKVRFDYSSSESNMMLYIKSPNGRQSSAGCYKDYNTWEHKEITEMPILAVNDPDLQEELTSDLAYSLGLFEISVLPIENNGGYTEKKVGIMTFTDRILDDHTLPDLDQAQMLVDKDVDNTKKTGYYLVGRVLHDTANRHLLFYKLENYSDYHNIIMALNLLKKEKNAEKISLGFIEVTGFPEEDVSLNLSKSCNISISYKEPNSNKDYFRNNSTLCTIPVSVDYSDNLLEIKGEIDDLNNQVVSQFSILFNGQDSFFSDENILQKYEVIDSDAPNNPSQNLIDALNNALQGDVPSASGGGNKIIIAAASNYFATSIPTVYEDMAKYRCLAYVLGYLYEDLSS